MQTQSSEKLKESDEHSHEEVKLHQDAAAEMVNGDMVVDESSSSSEEIKRADSDCESLRCEEILEVKKKITPQKNDLAEIAAGRDCYIGDNELLGSKKALTARHTPSALVAQLIAKLP